MARPTHGYRNSAGERVPGTTTVLSSFGDKGGLVYAANKLGLEGKSIKDEWYGKAANIGSLAHDLFEAEIHRRIGSEPISVDTALLEPPELKKAQTAFEAACGWLDQTRLKVLFTEKPLVSEALQLGGTPDAVAVDTKDRVVVCDWKSGGVYGSALFQVATYKLLIEETLNLKVEGFHVVRFAKDTGDFVHRFYPELEQQEKAIPEMVKLYHLLKATDKRAA